MGTAVLHPQECLPRSQSRPNGGFPFASEYAATRPSLSLSHDPMESCSERYRLLDASKKKVTLRHSTSSAGLLPLPVRTASPASKIPPDSYKRCRSPGAAYASAKPMRRYSFSQNLSLDGRRQPISHDLGSVMPARSLEIGRPSHLPLASIPNSHFSFARNDAVLTLAEQNKVEWLSAASVPVTQRSRCLTMVTKQLFKDMPLARTQSSSCRSSKTLTRRQGGIRQPNPSDMTEEKAGINVAFCGNQQVSRKLDKSVSKISALITRRGAGLCSLNLAKQTEKPRLHGSLRTKRHQENSMSGQSFVETAGPLPSLQSQLGNDMKARSVVNEKKLMRVNECRKLDINSQGSPTSIRNKEGVPKGPLDTLSEVILSRARACDPTTSLLHLKAKEVLECVDLANDSNSWLSVVNEGWAGPSFFNSPPPNCLPVPKFTVKLSTTASTSPEVARKDNLPSPNGALTEVKRIQDIALATQDLRRLLRLDHASFHA
ncbi:hypothetical protein L7F22_017844 [Adiantum nelumboides]|nr:hypothetical protein [Adiantum nelumboides]